MSRRAAIGNTLRHPSFRVAAVDMAGTAVGIGAWGLPAKTLFANP